MNEPFAVTDCALVVIATGEKAYNLRELLDRLTRMDNPDLMYFHFWAGLLRPHFLDPEYPNDFGAWAYHSLHDKILAERLSSINPTKFASLDDVRQRVIEIVEDRMEENFFETPKEAAYPFYFQRSQIVVFDTHLRITRPADLAVMVPKMTSGSVFYHLIDAWRRTPSGLNDFSEWLKAWGAPYDRLGDKIATIDPFFASLMDLRKELRHTTEEFMKNEEAV